MVDFVGCNKMKPFSVRVSGFIRARLTATESLAEGFSVTGRHDIVQDWIDGGREIVEAAGNVVHLLVDLVVVRVFFAVDVEKSLSVERCPADEEANHYSHLIFKQIPWKYQ